MVKRLYKLSKHTKTTGWYWNCSKNDQNLWRFLDSSRMAQGQKIFFVRVIFKPWRNTMFVIIQKEQLSGCMNNILLDVCYIQTLWIDGCLNFYFCIHRLCMYEIEIPFFWRKSLVWKVLPWLASPPRNNRPLALGPCPLAGLMDAASEIDACWSWRFVLFAVLRRFLAVISTLVKKERDRRCGSAAPFNDHVRTLQDSDSSHFPTDSSCGNPLTSMIICCKVSNDRFFFLWFVP